MSPVYILLHILVLTISLSSVICLPVTSKPIENTPEHLAWEAWIMVPPTQEKVRKITPKSIFILPNKTNGGGNGGSNSDQIQCPPGYRVDNSRCIPTVNIDRDQILIAQLTNLLLSTDKNNASNNSDSNYSYDYDYDYEEAYSPGDVGALEQTGNQPSDYSGGPLKINLSLDKFPVTRDDNKNVGNFGIVEDADASGEEINAEPFRRKETSTTSSNSSTSSSTFQSIFSTEDDTSKQSDIRSATDVSKMDFSDYSKSPSDVRATTTTIDFTTPNIPILSSSELEMLSLNPNKSNMDNDNDYGFMDRTTLRTTLTNDDDLDIVTETEDSTKKFNEDLRDEMLVLENTATGTSIEPEDSTETTEIITTTNNQENTGTTLTEETTNDDKFEERKPSGFFLNQGPKFVSHKNNDDDFSKDRNTQSPLQLHGNRESFSEGTENHNRFVYHHLNSDPHHQSNQMQTTPRSTAQDIQEQLRIINRIVEENKRRAQQFNSQVKFPENDHKNHEIRENNRDFVRFPNPVHHFSSPPSPPPPSPHHEYAPHHQYLKHNQHHPQWPHPPSVITPTSTNANAQPIWWLPSGWEVDRNGDRPLLLRFWSRMPLNHPNAAQQRLPPASASSSTTSGYRENSRSPTEGLYKDAYKVLGTRQWKHNNR